MTDRKPCPNGGSADMLVSGSRSWRAFLAALLFSAALPADVRAQECIQDGDCADASVCNGIERCVATTCVPSTPIPCDDSDPCTRDECDPAAGCAHPEELCPSSCAGLADGTPCADGTVCTRGDACAAGVCVAGPSVTCSGLDECTASSCDPVYGCVYTETVVAPPCASDCTGGVADFTRCAGDDDPCTLDACLPSVDFSVDKCVDNLLLNRQCADDDLCNGAEWCSPLLGCQADAPLACDDGDACNGTETCDAETGCVTGTPLPDGTACDDHKQCTGGDQCASTTCSGVALTAADCDDSNAATEDSCREGFGCLNCAPLETAALNVRLAGAGASNGKLKSRGKVGLGGAAIAPAAESFAVIVTRDGEEKYRAELAAGTITTRAPGRYVFADKTGLVANGLRTLRLSERSGTLTWKTSSTSLADTGPVASAASLVVVIGDDCFSAGLTCSTNASGTKLKCSR